MDISSEPVTGRADLIEEIARIYGYQELPSNLVSGAFPQPFPGTFFWENKVKHTLKNWGFIEVYTYSLQSTELLEKTHLDPARCLQLKNPCMSVLTLLLTLPCEQSSTGFITDSGTKDLCK